MPKISDEEAQRIIQQKMPGYTVINRTSDLRDSDNRLQAEPEITAPDLEVLQGKDNMNNSTASDATASSSGSSLDELYEKFLGKTRNSDAVSDEENIGKQSTIVAVKPAESLDSGDTSDEVRTRNVVINPNTEEIEGFSG